MALSRSPSAIWPVATSSFRARQLQRSRFRPPSSISLHPVHVEHLAAAVPSPGDRRSYRLVVTAAKVVLIGRRSGGGRGDQELNFAHDPGPGEAHVEPCAGSGVAESVTTLHVLRKRLDFFFLLHTETACSSSTTSKAEVARSCALAQQPGGAHQTHTTCAPALSPFEDRLRCRCWCRKRQQGPP